MPTQIHLGTLLAGKDIFLSHTGADKPWVENLAGLIEAVPYKDRHLGVVFDKWDFANGKNIVLEIDKHIDECRFVGLVVTKAMLAAEWPTLERTIAVCSDPSGRKGRVLVLLKENVDLPPSLRMRKWIDFRDIKRFEESFLELISVLRGEPIRRGRGSLQPMLPTMLSYNPTPTIITASSGADRVTEQLITNLLPITTLPTVVQTGTTPLRNKGEIEKYRTATTARIPPFLLREGKLFTFSDLRDTNNPLQNAVSIRTLRDEHFPRWFADEDRRRWAIELLNLCLKEHCWQRHLRFEKKGQRFFFAPYRQQPKTITWYIGGRKHTREVTTPHYGIRKTPSGGVEQQQYGWRHQALRTRFVQLPSGLFLKLSPTYLLTKEDGKTPRGGAHVGPILSHWLNQERNGQILRSVRFWSLVLTRGNRRELIMPTGHENIVIDLTPATATIAFGINGDTIDFDRLVNAEYEDDLRVPELVPQQSEQLRLFDQPAGDLA